MTTQNLNIGNCSSFSLQLQHCQLFIPLTLNFYGTLSTKCLEEYLEVEVLKGGSNSILEAVAEEIKVQAEAEAEACQLRSAFIGTGSNTGFPDRR